MSFKDGVGQASNKFCQLIVVFLMAQEHGVTIIQIFGDSLLEIQWMKHASILRNFMLQPFVLDVMSLQSTFTHISFEHVYRKQDNRLLIKRRVRAIQRSLESL